MIRRVCLLFIVLSFCVFTAGAQEKLIPRRIQIIADEGAEGTLLPSILYARLTRRVPLVVSGPDDEPHNRIIINTGEVLSVSLEDRDGVVDSRDFPPEIAEDSMAAAEAFDLLAKDWEPLLDLVPPDVTQELRVQRTELESEVSFEDQLITPFQATLWLPISARQILLTEGSRDSRTDSKWLWLWPLRADLAWYFQENLGVVGSLRFEHGRHISFGSDIYGNPLDTVSTIMMAGIGMQVRTLGRLSAEFGITAHFGAVRVKAEETLVKPALAAGESTWVFYPMLSFEPAMVWSPTPKLSVKFRILEFNLGLDGLGGTEDAPYGTGESTILFNLFQLGAAYRW
ncbi:MAG: hypothetical protein P1P77_12410 [Spirochaetaceae bacterium]|nr:hypothetical protein [Spirochaetaceae bacterium]